VFIEIEQRNLTERRQFIIKKKNTHNSKCQTIRSEKRSALLLRMECKRVHEYRSIAPLLITSCSINPSGAVVMAAAPMYLALIPVTYVFTPAFFPQPS
jgi:hypothetical protein